MEQYEIVLKPSTLRSYSRGTTVVVEKKRVRFNKATSRLLNLPKNKIAFILCGDKLYIEIMEDGYETREMTSVGLYQMFNYPLTSFLFKKLKGEGTMIFRIDPKAFDSKRFLLIRTK